MALDIRNVRVIAHGAAVSDTAPPNKIFHHATNDTRAAAYGSNYYDDLATKMGAKIGDIIIGSYDLDGTPQSAVGMVTAVGAHVTIALAFGQVDA